MAKQVIDIGQIINKERTSVSMTISELSRLSNISARQIQRIEGGYTLKPKKETIDKLLSVLGFQIHGTDNSDKVISNLVKEESIMSKVKELDLNVDEEALIKQLRKLDSASVEKINKIVEAALKIKEFFNNYIKKYKK